MTANRDEYIEKLKQQLDKWNSEIDDLEEKSEEIKGEAQKKYNTQITELRQQLQTIRNNLEAMQKSGKDKWERMKTQVEDVREAFVHSFNYFKSQI